MQTSSRSIRVMVPMPLRASASAAHEPTPPIPITQTWLPYNLRKPFTPKLRSMPSKRKRTASGSSSSVFLRSEEPPPPLTLSGAPSLAKQACASKSRTVGRRRRVEHSPPRKPELATPRHIMYGCCFRRTPEREPTLGRVPRHAVAPKAPATVTMRVLPPVGGGHRGGGTTGGWKANTARAARARAKSPLPQDAL
eukprot:scaffold2437_cov395-Prasinococcus_capsulatus_cf.AAC.1